MKSQSKRVFAVLYAIITVIMSTLGAAMSPVAVYAAESVTIEWRREASGSAAVDSQGNPYVNFSTTPGNAQVDSTLTFTLNTSAVPSVDKNGNTTTYSYKVYYEAATTDSGTLKGKIDPDNSGKYSLPVPDASRLKIILFQKCGNDTDPYEVTHGKSDPGSPDYGDDDSDGDDDQDPGENETIYYPPQIIEGANNSPVASVSLNTWGEWVDIEKGDARFHFKATDVPAYAAEPTDYIFSIDASGSTLLGFNVIMSLSLKCGLATSEVLRLKREQFRVIDGANYIYIPAASVKKESRYVKVPDDVYQIYIDYLGSDPETDDAGHLFLNKRGNVMRINNIEAALDNAEKAAGIEGHFTLKDLRNRAVLSMLKASNDPAGVAAQVGIRGLRMESFIRSAGMFDNNKAPGDLINFKIQPFGSTHETR